MTLIINKSDEHNDYFTFTDDAATEYQWHKRKGIEIANEKILLLIRNREYPDAPKEASADLEVMEDWIKDGCMLRDDEGQYTGKAERVPWTSTHPPDERIIDGEKISGDTLADLDALIKKYPEMKVLKTILKGA